MDSRTAKPRARAAPISYGLSPPGAPAAGRSPRTTLGSDQRAGDGVFVGNHLVERVLQYLLREEGRHAGDGAADQRSGDRDAVADARRHAHAQLLRLPREIHFARHHDARGRALDAEAVGARDAAVDLDRAEDVVEREPVAEDVAEIERDPARQRLQGQDAEQLADARIRAW